MRAGALRAGPLREGARRPGPLRPSTLRAGANRLRHAVPLAVLLALTAALYTWRLAASGWANHFYAAAVQAGTRDPVALLFGSLDSANAITVDKPPAALWVMGLSARIFGFSPWSMLVPQALEGVAAVALLYAAVARWSGRPAGLAAGTVLALTPVATVMFRMNDPDALMILLLVAAGYCTVRACDAEPPAAKPDARPRDLRWTALAGVAAGFAFLAKMDQALVVLPALAAAYLVSGPGRVRRRLLGLSAAGIALTVSAGWYVALVALWPAGSRPYIGGSTNDSLAQLALGYNGIGRLAGGDGNPSSGWGAGAGRLFGDAMGAQISWLLPAALTGLAVLIAVSLRAPRRDRVRAAAILWGGWLLIGAVVLSAMQGIVHAYYTAMLAPAIAALVAAGGAQLWRCRDRAPARLAAAVTAAASGAWAFVLLERTPQWLPWLRWVILLGSAAASLALACAAVLPLVSAAAAWAREGLRTGVRGNRPAARTTVLASAAACVLALLGPCAYSVATAAQPHGGSAPKAGPGSGASAAQLDRVGSADAPPALISAVHQTRTKWAAAAVGAVSAARLELAAGRPVMAVGGYTGRDPAPTLEEFRSDVAAGRIRYFLPRTAPDLFGALLGAGIPPGGEHGAVAGGERHAPDAASGSSALRLLVATTTAAQRREHGPPVDTHDPRELPSAAITDWVRAHFTEVRFGDLTVYDLADPVAPGGVRGPGGGGV